MGESKKVFVAAAAIAALLLTGCAGGGVSGSPVPSDAAGATPSGEPTAEPSSEPVVWPLQLVQTSCDALVPQEIRDGAFGRELPSAAGYSNGEGPKAFHVTAFENAGGLNCRWEAAAGTGNREDDWGIGVQLLPRSDAARERISTEMGAEQASPTPSVGCDWRACSLNALVGEYWIGASVVGLPEPHHGGEVPVEAAGVFDTVLAAVAAVPPSSDPVLPGQAVSWPTSCDELIPESQLAAALDYSASSFTAGYSYEANNVSGAAFLSAGGLVCGLASGGGSRVGSIFTLPGSGLAFADARARALDSDASEAVLIPGLGPDDAYLTWREDIPGRATLSLSVNDMWTQIDIADGVSGEPEMPAEERLAQFAAYLVAVQ